MSENSDTAPTGAERLRRFERVFESYYEPVSAFVGRRASASMVDDIVAETFVVAWRRGDDLQDDPLPWLLGVARRVIANELRGERRRNALVSRLKDTAADHQVPAPLLEPIDSELVAALGTLSDTEREVLLLVGWDGLTPTQAAQVVGCSSATFRVRLHRARRRLAAAIATATDDPWAAPMLAQEST